MGIYYREQSRKGFKVKLAVTKEEVEKYLESWNPGIMTILGFSFFKCYGTDNEHVIWCLKYNVENSYKVLRCYDKYNDETNLCSYRIDILDIAYHSRKEGKLLCIYFDESLISEYDKDMMIETFYPMTLNDNVNPWNDMNVIVETTQELCGHEDQSKEVECSVKEIKSILLAKNFVYDIRGTLLLLKQVSSKCWFYCIGLVICSKVCQHCSIFRGLKLVLL